jgi:hypothetical protein
MSLVHAADDVSASAPPGSHLISGDHVAYRSIIGAAPIACETYYSLQLLHGGMLCTEARNMIRQQFKRYSQPM